MSDFSVPELLLLQLFLIILNAVFACAEIAVISINETKLKRMSEDGDRRAKRLLSLTQQPAKFLATIQVGITLAGFLGSAFAADSFSEPLAQAIVGESSSYYNVVSTVCMIVITLILSYFSIVFGELVDPVLFDRLDLGFVDGLEAVVLKMLELEHVGEADERYFNLHLICPPSCRPW